ncbi:hypothetical protein BDF22DRAFT_739095 [Syncephalis plumigaleata]|nr:hypothetical protein BDF22DRAFT_739095 [Syncephalis plumigaleata]
MNPLHQFAFTKDGPVDINLADPKQMYVCHLYSFVKGMSLLDYFEKSTPAQAYIVTARILPDIIKGLLYLYNARIVHNDIAPRKQDSNGKYIPKIIDYDLVIVFDEKTNDWARINPNNKEYLLPDPPQKYSACSELSESVAIEKLNVFNECLITAGLKKRVPGLPLKLPDVEPALPSMRYLLKRITH